MKRKNTKLTTYIVTESMGICKYCGTEMVKGRRVMPTFEGIGTYAHVTCWDANWNKHMQQVCEEFEQEILDNNTTTKP